MGRFSTREPGELAAATSVLAGEREFIDIAIPGTNAVGKMRVLTRSESLAAKAECLTLFRERGLIAADGAVAQVAHDDWRCEVAVRHLAVAIRDPDSIDAPLAPVDDWRELTDEQISGPWDRYQDLRDRLDPLGEESRPLTDDEITLLRDAAKKKDVVLLRSYGLHRLALYAITTAAAPPS